MPDPRSNGTKRKVSDRATSGIKKPKTSEILRKRWLDPVYRAKMIEVLRLAQLDRKLHPEKHSRHRVPDGMRKKTAMPLWAKAETLADRFMSELEANGDIPEKGMLVPDSDEAKAAAALREAFIMAVGPGDNKIKTANVRTILEWCKSKPESKSKVTVEKAEDWLAAAQAEVDSGV